MKNNFKYTYPLFYLSYPLFYQKNNENSVIKIRKKNRVLIYLIYISKLGGVSWNIF